MTASGLENRVGVGPGVTWPKSRCQREGRSSRLMSRFLLFSRPPYGAASRRSWSCPRRPCGRNRRGRQSGRGGAHHRRDVDGVVELAVASAVQAPRDPSFDDMSIGAVPLYMANRDGWGSGGRRRCIRRACTPRRTLTPWWILKSGISGVSHLPGLKKRYHLGHRPPLCRGSP